MIDKNQCSDIVERILKFSEADETEIFINSEDISLTRFANNAIHQNVASQRRDISVRASFGRKTGRASTNRCDDESLKNVVQRSSDSARNQNDDPELLPVPDAFEYASADSFSPATAECGPSMRAAAVAEIVRVACEHDLSCAGAFYVSTEGECVANSRGLFGYATETLADLSVTLTTGESSGWACGVAADVAEIDAGKIALRAAKKAVESRSPREIEPGDYTVIIEHAGVSELLLFVAEGFNGQEVIDQTSFLTDKLNTKLFGDNITIRDDVYHPLQSGSPFDGEGVPRKAVTLVDKGVVAGLVHSRKSAAAMGAEPTGHGFLVPNTYGAFPMNFVMEGGDASLEDMIASTERGILMTRVWYAIPVDPMKLIITGMTRDGTFLIEDGRVRYPLRNMRFNQSLIGLLNGVEMMSTPERSVDGVAPAIKASGFHFTSAAKH